MLHFRDQRSLQHYILCGHNTVGFVAGVEGIFETTTWFLHSQTVFFVIKSVKPFANLHPTHYSVLSYHMA